MSSDENGNEKTYACCKCKSNIDNEDYVICEYCTNRICESCQWDGYAVYVHKMRYTYTDMSMCFFCAKNNDIYPGDIMITLTDWRFLRNKYEKKKQYIAELEAEIKLLKAMVDFQVGGEGYLDASKHFKQLADKNDAIDDNCDDNN
jgi:hypothetical protein